LLDHVVASVGGFGLSFETLPAGAAHFRDTGDAFPEKSRQAAAKADAILLGAMGLPDVRYPDGTEISPQLDLRFDLDLYAGVRPVRAVPGLSLPLADPRAATLDFVLVRESTEGLFASHGKGTLEGNETATDTLVITRKVSEKLFDFCFRLAEKRRQKGHAGRVTCVDKANVFSSFAFFRSIFDERAALNPNLGADYAYVDATALNMVRNPWDFDVLVTENMFGDILSDLGAGLIGGMGMAPSADIGDNHAVFQPCHGTAPDIVGTGKANPTAMILSAAMMLDWLGDKHGMKPCQQAADLLVAAVDRTFEGGELVPFELGGSAGTTAIYSAVQSAFDELLARQDTAA
jgi:3-isopropylmalate dehydrogenase